MTAKERADKCVVEGLLRDSGGWTGSAASAVAIEATIEAAILEEREACKLIVRQSTQNVKHLGGLIIREIDRRGQS